ncbi:MULTISPECIES: metalloregulator ArsR/SmtB family transcription factor [unclassified Afipia]|uniref:ArsR/SmtB family transcription factor n=1 Tax=unclassified Afipia TaxID=2642050 RepID=UPI00040D513D|nr:MULTISPECIES: metalloregulator ArsR/SmtB family transcription factor [unclassified Afipia]
MPASQQLDHMFHALADPYRRSMVERLSRGPASVKQLADPMEMALPSAVKHLRILEEGGLVASKKAGRVRTYTIKPQALASIGRWVKQRETAMNQAFDRLAQAIADFPEQDGK